MLFESFDDRGAQYWLGPVDRHCDCDAKHKKREQDHHRDPLEPSELMPFSCSLRCHCPSSPATILAGPFAPTSESLLGLTSSAVEIASASLRFFFPFAAFFAPRSPASCFS